MSRPHKSFQGKPPLKGIFPLDHHAECKDRMKTYLDCMKQNDTEHYKCKHLTVLYLQCRMDRDLMQQEDLNDLGLGQDRTTTIRVDKIGTKERDGFLSGENVKTRRRGWWA